MATLAKVFRHQTVDCEDLDNTAAVGTLARDIEDYITANAGTVHNDTNLNVSSWSVGLNVYTLVVIGDDS